MFAGWVGSLLIVIALSGQSTKVELSGLVQDPSGLPVQGAEVRVLHMSTQAEQSNETSGDGRYHFFALQPGTYAITIAKSGFTPQRRDGIALRVGDQIALDFSLQIGNISESVNVTAAAP